MLAGHEHDRAAEAVFIGLLGCQRLVVRGACFAALGEISTSFRAEARRPSPLQSANYFAVIKNSSSVELRTARTAVMRRAPSEATATSALTQVVWRRSVMLGSAFTFS
jgi:hypothetical protein